MLEEFFPCMIYDDESLKLEFNWLSSMLWPSKEIHVLSDHKNKYKTSYPFIWEMSSN